MMGVNGFCYYLKSNLGYLNYKLKQIQKHHTSHTLYRWRTGYQFSSPLIGNNLIQLFWARWRLRSKKDRP